MEAEISRSLLETRYNPSKSYDKSLNLRRNTTQADYEAWLNHPLTQALLLSLEGDVAGLFLVWSAGGYAATLTEDAKARGILEAVDGCISLIRGMKTGLDDE